MSLRTTYSAETWEKVYQAFAEVNFTAFDFDTVKQSLVDYTRTYYPEQFNDFIQSSEFVALLEIFAYICEQLAYRLDMVAHENFITTAQRKQSILRLAKLISYKATRNIPIRGLVKLTSVSTTEQVTDSRGVNLSGLRIIWNDPNNPNWKEQFFLVMNRVLTTRFGQPQKTFQIGDVVMDLYALSNDTTSFPLGVFAFSAETSTETFQMEVVPADIDENGPFEREPDPEAAMSIIYANDGVGDGSDYTGFLMHVKQGTLSKIDYFIDQALPDRRVDFLPQNINHTDVWVQKVDENNRIVERWMEVESVNEQNLAFNSIRDTRTKYEVDTIENDQIRVVFGDGDFSDVPQGPFRFWMRQSIGRSIVIPKNRIINQTMGFSYTASTGLIETCTLTFSLTTTLQNGAATETIEHIRRSAPATYYAQNRMVNGQDYNTYMLKDPTILRLKAINRTFAGQPKYIDWNDASGQYENVKLFGDDMVMRHTLTLNTQTTTVSGRSLIDSIIEPLLSSSGIINLLTHISAQDPATAGVVSAPRRKFIEDNRGGLYTSVDGNYVKLLTDSTLADGSLKEKTAIQATIDRHWYGEPLSTVVADDGTILGVIPDPDQFPTDDSRIYQENLPRTIDGINRFPPGDIGSGLQPVGAQKYFGLRYNRYMKGIGNGTIDLSYANTAGSQWLDEEYFLEGEVWTIEIQANGQSYDVRSNLRGSFPAGTISSTPGQNVYQIQPQGFAQSVDFIDVVAGTIDFEPGDAFILDTAPGGVLSIRSFPAPAGGDLFNLNGWWEVLRQNALPDYSADSPSDIANVDQLFSMSQDPTEKQHSWVIFVRRLEAPPSNATIGYEVNTRDLKLVVESPTTKFWYNSVTQLMDNETKKRVFDNIKILRSNLDSNGIPLGKSQVYDVVGAVADENGVVDFNQLEIVPTDLLNEDDSGDLIADRVLQFETFSAGSFEHFDVTDPTVILTGTAEDYAVALFVTAAPGSLSVEDTANPGTWYGRRLKMPNLSTNGDEGLDFMWQHFTPFNNIIDPSVTNIHDLYLMTRGYYDSVISYVRGTTTVVPTPPTPLQLRSDYGYLLQNKMLSDTVVLHPGRVKLLFGTLADPQLRAKFKVVRQQGASLTNERIKEEILNVINIFFDIDTWDFGDTFYATELITLIHQRLPTDIASVVLVPVYSTNSFGSLFTVDSGHDEILQSAAAIEDIDIVEALTPTVIKQVR